MGSNAANVNKSQHSIPIDILDDLCSRFIINLPPEDRGNLVRICFQIELAHWFYLDYYCTDETTGLYPCGIREFAAHIFQFCKRTMLMFQNHKKVSRHIIKQYTSNVIEDLVSWTENC